MRELSTKALEAIEKVVGGVDYGSVSSIVSEHNIPANQWPTPPRAVWKLLDGIVQAQSVYIVT